MTGLNAATTYNYRVRSRDESGNLTVSANQTFTTLAVGACPCSVWPVTTTPAVTASTDANPIEVGMRVRSDSDGVITGLRFYKGAANTGTHVGHLWTNTGTLLATAIFVDETASGWQEVMFASPVQVSANTTYVASYFAPVGRYAQTVDGLGVLQGLRLDSIDLLNVVARFQARAPSRRVVGGRDHGKIVFSPCHHQGDVGVASSMVGGV